MTDETNTPPAGLKLSDLPNTSAKVALIRTHGLAAFEKLVADDIAAREAAKAAARKR